MRIMIIAAAIVALTAAVALGLSGSGKTGQAAFPGINGDIVFSRTDNNGTNLWRRGAGGGTSFQITTGDVIDHNPAYSADGSMIAFDRQDPDRSIWVMDVHGSNQQMVPNTAGGVGPAWSPDGKQLVFTLDADIVRIGVDGSGLTNLTNTPSESEFSPDWSPDGTMIAYRRDSEIYVMGAGGSNPTGLTDTPDMNESDPNWSPDGERIVYQASGPTTSDGDVFVMNSDGSGASDLTADFGGSQLWPAFSPDGKRIAYTQTTAEAFPARLADAGLAPTQIFTMDADGSNKRNQTADSLLQEYGSDWQPLSATPTPAPTEPPGQDVIWGDNRCDGKLDATDGLAVLRHVAALSELSQTAPCPAIGLAIRVLQPGFWGDVDCDQDVDSVDDLKVLRQIAGFVVMQPANCYPIGLVHAVIHY